MKTKAKVVTLSAMLALGVLSVGCESTPVKPVTQADRDYLREDAQATMQAWQRDYPSATQKKENAYAYVIFPEVTKAAVAVGGAYGRGIVYEQGRFIGYADLSQGTIGAQFGGQSYAELILFENKAALETFKRGDLAFAAQASAIAANKSASTDVSYKNGVMVFTSGKGGLMLEAAIGGQKFRFVPAM